MPCPGGPKSQSPDAKPKSASCFESECRDLELLKCWAALSECRLSRLIIWTVESGTPPIVCAFRYAIVAATKCRML